MRVVFMGTPKIATRILNELLLNYEIPLVLTAMDKPVGRKQILTPPDVKQNLISKNFSGEIFQPKSLKNDEAIEKIRSYKPDFIVVCAYGMILPKAVLDIAPCINIHASLLPKYRGASPIQTAIKNGDKIGGVCAMMMEEGLDTGAILGTSYADISNLRVDECFELFGDLGAKLIIKVLKNYHLIKEIPQNNDLSTHCAKIEKSDGIISFDDNAIEVWNKFKAFYIWPSIAFSNGIKLKNIKFHNREISDFDAGCITEITKNSIFVKFKDKDIEILSIQEPAKKEISGFNYANGKRLKIGDKIF